MSKNWSCSWQWISSKIHQQCSRSENSAKNTDIITSGPVVNFHSLWKWAEGFASVEEIICRSFSQGCQPGSSSSTTNTSTTTSSQYAGDSTFRPAVTRSQSTSGKALGDQWQFRKRWGHAKSTWKPVAWYSWISGRFQRKSFGRQKFRHQGARPEGSSQESETTTPREVVLGNTLFRHSCPQGSEFWKYAGNQDYKGLLQETHGWSHTSSRNIWWPKITADHKDLSEGCDSRHSQRYAALVQDLALQCFQAFPLWMEKFTQETEKSSRKFLAPWEKHRAKSHWHWQFLGIRQSLQRIILDLLKSTPHRSETTGNTERAVRRVREGTSALLLQSGLDEKWWAVLWNATAIGETSKTSWWLGKLHHERRFGEPFKGPMISFGAMAEFHLISIQDPSRLYQFGEKVSLGILLSYALIAAEFGKETFWSRTLMNWRKWTLQKSISMLRARCERNDNAETWWEFHNPSLRDKRHCWENGSESQRRNFWDEWKRWGNG